MSKYFGTDGFRGEANIDLTVEHAFKIGRFLGWYFGQLRPCRVVIGKDTRRFSFLLVVCLAWGLTASGADVFLLHVTTTPSVSYITRTDSFDCGIMISASHNPYYDNGIKLINMNGEKMEEEVINEVEKYLDGHIDEIPYAKREYIGRTVDYVTGRNRYIGYLITLAQHSYKGMKVGLDCANGSAWMIAKNIFETLGAETIVISNRPNGLNINERCGSTHIERLQEIVRENHLDVGFAFDGDADRCLAVDNKGNVVDGDLILYVYGTYMKEREKLNNNTIVTTIMSNLGLLKALDKADINYIKVPVGDKNVYDAMRNGGYVFGGEQSGHIIFSKYASSSDGILTAMKIMQVILDKKMPLSKLIEPVLIYPQVLKNARVIDRDKALLDEDIKAAIQKVEEKLGDSGRLLVRKSGTEPLIRIMVEAPTNEECEENVNLILDVLQQKNLLLEVK